MLLWKSVAPLGRLLSYIIELSALNAQSLPNIYNSDLSLSRSLPSSALHIYAKTITRASHKFMECQRKADRRKNNDIMLTHTCVRIHTHTHILT